MNEEQKEKRKDFYKENREKLLEYQKSRYKDSLSIFQSWRKTLKCSKCEEHDAACLEFHHSDPSQKEANVIRMLTRSLKTVSTELKKCVVVCANCHAKIHAYDIKTDPTLHDLSTDFDDFCKRI